MVALSATAVSTSSYGKSRIHTCLTPQHQNALEEWQSRHFVRRQFEAERYMRTYASIKDYIVDRLETDPRAKEALERFSSWAGESYVVSPPCPPEQQLIIFISAFVQDLPEE